MRLVRAFLTISFSFAFAACGFQGQKGVLTEAPSEFEALGLQSQVTEGYRLQVIDEQGYPVVGAQVLVGSAPDQPFAGNSTQTDDQGVAHISPAWQGDLPITVESRLHLRSTFWNMSAGDHTLRISDRDGENLIQVSGQTTGFGNLQRDGNLHYGLVIPAFTRADLLHFDIADVISPEVDVIRILGNNVELPSNLTLPRQRENYVFPITFDKPNYRAFVRQPGVRRFVATHGNFPFRRVIDEVRAGKSMFEVINHFNFISGGLRDIVVGPGGAQQDLSVNQISFDTQVAVTAPPFARDEIMISLAMGLSDGHLFPTDIKRLESGETRQLKSTGQSSEGFVLSAFKKYDGANRRDETPAPTWPDCDDFYICDNGPSQISLADFFSRSQESFTQLSFALTPASSSTQPIYFMPLIEAPVLAHSRQLNFEVPAPEERISPLGTLVILSEIEMVGQGEMKFEKRTRLWQVMAGSWIDQLDLPEMDWPRQPGRSYRWEVLFLGQDLKTGQQDSRALSSRGANEGVFSVDAVTHVTRNALDF